MKADLVLTESVSVNQLAKLAGVNHTTAWNWIRNGVTVYGRKVKLPATRLGWRYSVSPEQWEQFKHACNPDPPTLPESPAQERRRMVAAQKAAAELLG